MTEDEKNKIVDKYNDISFGELLKKLLVLTGKYILVFMLYILKLILKGIVWCGRKCMEGLHAVKVFWNSNDTQEKKKKVIEHTKQGCRDFREWCKVAWAFIKKYTVIGAKLTWKYFCKGCRLAFKYFLITCVAIYRGIKWTIITVKDLIIHSKPTFIRLGKSIKQGTIDFGHWIVRVCRGIKLRHIRRKRAWQHFRRTKGFKGLLIDMGHGLSNGIQSYMSEEDTAADPEAVTEDDIIAEELEERQGDSDKHKLSKKIFKGVKDIVEEKG